MIQRLLIVMCVLFVQANPIKGAIQDTLVDSEIYMKMMPERATIFDVYNLSNEGNRIFREGTEIVFTTKENRGKQRGKIIGFENNEIIVHDEIRDEISEVPLDEIVTIRKRYGLLGFASGISFGIGAYTLLGIIIAGILLTGSIFINNQNNIGFGALEIVFAVAYITILSLMSIAITITSMSVWNKYKKYKLSKKWKPKLFEVRPLKG